MTIATAATISDPAYVDTFIRYSDRTAEGGFIRANGDYSFGMEDHPARVHNARLEQIEFGTTRLHAAEAHTDVEFCRSRRTCERR